MRTLWSCVPDPKDGGGLILKDIIGPDHRSLDTTVRIAKICKVHREHPEYTQKDLMMVCFESKYMVEKYYKESVLGKVAIIKTG